MRKSRRSVRVARDSARLSVVGALLLCAAITGCKSQQGTDRAAPMSDAKPLRERPYAVIDGQVVDVPAIPMGDPATIERIIAEGMKRNQVMDHLTHLCETIGPRLTGSTRTEEANRWAAAQFSAWGLTNVHQDQWGEVSLRFDREPSTARVMLRRDREVRGEDGATRTEVEYESIREMQFSWLAWAKGTEGAVRAPVIKMPETEEEFERVKDQLAGSWVLIRPARDGRQGIRGIAGLMSARDSDWKDIRRAMAGGEPVARPSGPEAFKGTITGPGLPEGGVPITITLAGRRSTVDIAGFHSGPVKDLVVEDWKVSFGWDSPGGTSTYALTRDGASLAGKAAGQAGEYSVTSSLEAPDARPRIVERVLAMNPVGFLSCSRDDRVWTSSVRGWRELSLDAVGKDTEYVLRQSDYDFINSRMYDGVSVEVEIDAKYSMSSGPIPVYNTVAEIRGTEFPDEVIIISAHLDSWDGPGSQGTIDNGTGSAVTLETARILMAAGAKPKRTIRFILWTGEEQGLLGSRSWVERNKDERPKISAVFVDDGGTNYQGGLASTTGMADMLAAASAPANGLFYDEVEQKWMNVNVRRIGERLPSGGGSDHASFNAVGVPGFFWDEIGRSDYGYGWHTQNDRLNLAIPEYLKQSATTSAITAYNLACAPSLLPRPAAPETPASGGQ